MPTLSGDLAWMLRANGKCTAAESPAAGRHLFKFFVHYLLGLLLFHMGSAWATPEPVERIAWRKAPIPIELQVRTERRVQFPNAVQLGVPTPLQGVLRVQSISGMVYLLAHEPFASTRVLVRDLDEGQMCLLDLSAAEEGAGTGPIEIFDPDDADKDNDSSTAPGMPTPAYGYVTLTRFAAQQLYAPARLLKDLPGVVRVPVKREPVRLVRGDSVEAVPLVAWRAGDVFLTAVKLTNKSRWPQVLDPRTLRGTWLTATFQHNRLHQTGSEAHRTVVYLISARPFAASL